MKKRRYFVGDPVMNNAVANTSNSGGTSSSLPPVMQSGISLFGRQNAVSLAVQEADNQIKANVPTTNTGTDLNEVKVTQAEVKAYEQKKAEDEKNAKLEKYKKYGMYAGIGLAGLILIKIITK